MRRKGLSMPYEIETPAVANPAIPVLRGLAAAGYMNQAQLSAMESILEAKTALAASGFRWLSIAEACRHSTFSRITLWKYCAAGLLTVRKVGRRRLIEQGELDAFILSSPPPADRLVRARKKDALHCPQETMLHLTRSASNGKEI